MSIAEIADIRLEAPPRLPDRIDPRRHEGDPPRFWVRCYLVLVCLIVFSGMLAGLWTWQMRQSHGELVPDLPRIPLLRQYEINRPVTAFDVVRDSRGRGTGLLVADDQAVHHGIHMKDLMVWRHVPLGTLLADLPAPRVVSLSAGSDRAALVCETEDGARRGVTATSGWPRSVAVWPKPIIDVSCFPGLEDSSAHCLLSDPRSKARLVGAMGIGIYEPATRHWVGSVSAGTGGLKIQEVYDLDFFPGGQLAVLGDGGIEIGSLGIESGSPESATWTGTAHFDRQSGLVGNGVRHGRVAGANLVYVTAPGGLGRLRLGRDGSAAAAECLVGEGQAPELTRAGLRLAAEDRTRGYVWMVHDAAGKSSLQSAAAYRVKGHEMVGLPPEQAWPGGDAVALAADPYDPAPTAWLGGRGLRQIRLQADAKTGANQLTAASVGLSDRRVDDIAINPHAVVVHAVRENGNDSSLSPHVVEAATRKSIQNGGSQTWSRPYIGQRRFPGLNVADLTAAAEGKLAGQHALYFGTKGKGIAAFLTDTREIVLAHHSKHPDTNRRVPHDGTLDLAAAGDLLVQVAADRTATFFNGTSWQTLIAEGGIDIQPSEVTTVVAEGTRLILGTANRIGSYDAASHQWASLPTVKDLERLHLGLDRLWAINKKRQLFSLPLTGAAAPEWKKEDDNVIDFFGDSNVVAAVAGPRTRPYMWMQQKGKERVGLRPAPLPRKGEPWKVAAANQNHLYVAPHDTGDGKRGIGAFDLTNHHWQSIPYPQDADAPRRLLATSTGLWMVDSTGALYYTAKDPVGWQRAAADVKWLSTDGTDVILLGNAGHVQCSTRGAPPLVTIVGKAFAGDLNQVTTATTYQDRLFVGTPDRVGWYETAQHSWHNYNGIPGVVRFAATAGYLYALTKDGQVLRWKAKEDQWERVMGGEKSLPVKQIAAEGGPVLYILQETPHKSAAVLALDDAVPDAAKPLIAATHLGGGQVSAAAEVDSDLYLGTTEGNIAAYGKAPGAPRTWTQILDVRQAGAIRQLLIHPAAPDALVAVGDKVWLLTREAKGKPWTSQPLLEKNVREGAIGAGDFYGLTGSGEEGPNIYHALTRANSTVDQYVGARFPRSDHPATVAAAISAAAEIFRVDASGTVAQFVPGENGWKPQNIRGVREFFRTGNPLWAWVPGERTLYGWGQNAWQAAEQDKEIDQVVGDGKELLIAKGDGSVKLRGAAGDVQLLGPRPSQPLPITAATQIRAALELDDRLLLAISEHPLLTYDQTRHTWRADGPPDVADMVLVSVPGADKRAVFARTAAGTLHRYDVAGDTWSRIEVPGGGKVTKVGTADPLAIARTDNGAIHFIDQAGKLLGSLAPTLIPKRTAADMRLRAVIELDGKLVVVPELAGDAAELWRYDADTHAWQVETIAVKGSPRYFLQAPEPWLVCQEKNGRQHLYRVASSEKMVDPATALSDLVDAASDGKSLWVITKDHHLQKLGANGKLEASGVPEPSLPPGRMVHRAFAVAGLCGVLLDDGSVHHYDARARQWIERVPALGEASELKGTLVRDESRRLLLVRPKEEVWACDMSSGVWTKLAAGGNIADLPPLPKDIPTPQWKVTGKPPQYEYAVTVGDTLQKRTLVDGRFDWDLPRRVAVAGDTVWLDTDGGLHKYQRKPGSPWEELAEKEKSFPQPAIDPLKLHGTRFLSRRDDQSGAFGTATGKVSLSTKVKEQWIPLSPGDNGQGAGFAHDVIRDFATAAKDIWLATAGGAVRFDGSPQPTLAEVAGPAQGLPEPSLNAILERKGALVARTDSKRYAALQAAGKWREVEASQASGLFAEAQSVLRYNELLRNWQLEERNQQVQLRIRLGGESVPVSLGPQGFGFDQPQAFSLVADHVRLWTRDGLAQIDRAKGPGPIVSLDHALRLPAFVGVADVIDDPKTPWLRSLGERPQVWQYGAGNWQPTTVADYEQALTARATSFVASNEFTWDRRDQVTFTVAGLNGGHAFTTQFDPQRGRFLLDVPYSIAVYENELWAFTAGGMVKFDRQKKWAHVKSVLLADKAAVRLIVLPENRLVAEAAGHLVQWDGKEWGKPANEDQLRKAIQSYDAFLLLGASWEIPRSDPRRMRLKLSNNQPLQDVVLGPDGLFDFENVHQIVADGASCVCGTDFGLVRADAASVDFTDLWKQAVPAVRVGRWKQGLYARLAPGDVLNLDAAAGAWKPAGQPDIFDRIDSTLLDGSGWIWTRQKGLLQVQLQQNAQGIWREADPLPVKLVGGHFDFDQVYDVGQMGQPWLVTAAGLLGREGEGFAAITRPLPFQAPRGEGRAMLNVVPRQAPQLFIRSAAGQVLQLDANKKWSPLSAEHASAVIRLAEIQETRSASFDAARLPNQELAIALHLPDDPAGRYKPIRFDADVGLFTFDQFSHVTRQAGQNAAILVAATGGVARFHDEDLPEPAMQRLYCDPNIDGLGPEPVEGLLLGKRYQANILATRDVSDKRQRFYLLGEDRWESGDATAERYRLEKMTLAYQEDAWQVLDLTQSPDYQPSMRRFDQRWRGQTVKLLSLKQTGDGGDLSRFAHDIPLSAALSGGYLWLATRGGVVGFPRRGAASSVSFDLASFTLSAEQTLTADELRGTAQWRGLTLVRNSGGTLFARRADGTALHCDPAKGDWTAIAPESPEFRAACRLAANSFWLWDKDGSQLDGIHMVFNPKRAKVPDNYDWTTGGTWSFLETGHTTRHAPRSSMAFFHGHLYLATAGGVTRFPEPRDDESVWPASPQEFVDVVYAVALGDGQAISMANIVQLYHDPDDDLLYARSASGQQFVFDQGRNEWSLCGGKGNPFDKANVVVNNELLNWTMSDHGWQLDVRPLLNDMPDQSTYPLFADGKFAFDKVRAFALLGSDYWLGTDGGVCQYEAGRFTPKRYYAKDFFEKPGRLPPVCEIAVNPSDSAQLLCRTRSQAADRGFVRNGDRWTESDNLSPLLQAYTRDEDDLMKFVQYPDGTLEAHLKDAQPAVLGTGRNKQNLPLFSRNRFSFDDVRAAVLEQAVLWSATPAGVVEYLVDWDGQTAHCRRVYCSLAAGATMRDLERIIRLPGNELLTWGSGNVYRTQIADGRDLQWRAWESVSGVSFKDLMRLPDGDIVWVLARRADLDDSFQLYRLTGGLTSPVGNERFLSIAKGFRSSDASQALMDERWIYQPVASGGLMRIDKSSVR